MSAVMAGGGMGRMKRLMRGASLGAMVIAAGPAGPFAGAWLPPAFGQEAAPIRFDIAPQDINGAILKFADRAGIQVFYDVARVQGLRSPGVSGTLSAQHALARLLADTGLDYRFTGAKSVSIVNPAAAAPGAAADAGSGGATVLDTIVISSQADGGSVYAPYETAAPTAHISGENIERFRGSSPADIFRGTAGVMSGEARNGGGGIDVNIRGMQGMGRVATTIDGAENAVTVYQGYQGVSNRTFVDPDFVAGVDITKGADAASFGNAGSVAMRTVSASDIVKPGDTWGIRVKGGFGTNTSKPNAGDVAGLDFYSQVPTPSETGLNRPSLLKPTSGSGSIVGAIRQEGFDLLAGYAYRKQGNYHAGKRGRGWVDPEYVDNSWINSGLANYRPGEEVLNTQLQTESWMFKGTAHIAEDQTLQLGYTGYRSEAGDRLASRLTGSTGRAQQQAQTVSTSLDTFTARYRWNPEDNDLFDLKANAYWTHLELRNPVRGGRLVTAPDIGLPAGFRVGSDSDMWGADISNLSKFSFDHGDLDLTYGLSYRAEDTRGSRHTAVLEAWNTPRDAIRHEVAGFVKAAYKPVDWATLNAGLRYSHYWSKDRFDPYERAQVRGKRIGLEVDGGGFSPSVGVTLEPFDGTQFYVNYSNTLRAPSVIESVSAFNSVVAQSDVRPERSSSWEIGTNFRHDDLFAAGDSAMLKLGYFNWDVKDYIARTVITGPGVLSLNIGNIHRARFSGIELSGHYENGGFSADLSANYFIDVEYCRTSGTCSSKSLYGDYATNHVQPEYTVDLTLSQKLFEDRLTLGGRISHVGPRAIGHGDVTAQGASQFISMIDWKPYTLVDLFGEYKISDGLTASVRVENLFDKFYVDPLNLVTQPGPGRTFYASLTGHFGGEQSLPGLAPLAGLVGANDDGEGAIRDWTGFYAGVHAGGALAREWGRTTALDGSSSEAATRESADERMRGGAFGFQAGYNHQFGSGLVLGVEASYSKTYMHGFKKVLSTDATLAANGHADAYTSYDIDWTAGLRAKLGYAVNDRLLVYTSGGLALARETQWRDQYVSNRASATQPLGTETGVFFTEKMSATRKGFTLGLGAEYALNDNWSILGDYSYSHFRAESFKSRKARAGTGKDYSVTTSTQVGTQIVPPSRPADHPTCTRPVPSSFCFEREVPVYEYNTTNYTGGSSVVEGRNASNKLDFHTFKVGLNYRF